MAAGPQVSHALSHFYTTFNQQAVCVLLMELVV